MRKAQLDRVEELEHPYPEGANRELYDVFFAALREKKAKWMDESKDYCKSESVMQRSSVWIRLNLSVSWARGVSVSSGHGVKAKCLCSLEKFLVIQLPYFVATFLWALKARY